ncbi:MAG TPA: hydantoinase/oxoprolinase family protein, partial [Solirubrobacteraceae bacterium]|nr:hydantoinase/oxoprolinase family protein [Solirubrobacteraceae bacterium]
GSGTHRMIHVGVDTGGTFTDFVALDVATGALHALKVPSVPADPARAVVHGLGRLRERAGIPPGAIDRFIFGTTVATNAILERKGGPTALVATRGTRDVLEIQRQWRHRLFDLALRRPEPLVPRRWRVEADERIAADGAAVTPLTDAEARRVAREVAALGVESVAIALLFSFVAPAHERQLRAALAREAPGLHVSLSSDVCPEFREYERTCTTAMNAYVMPKVHRLVARLEAELTAAGLAAPLRIMQSNGGLMSSAQARAEPVRTLLSGPAGGVVGAVAVAAAAGIGDVITMDMGGTSLDISLVRDGRVGLSADGRVGGFPVKIPQVDTHTIGAGGGSVARIVRGALKVGPDSAGADPGPACYGRGGTEPTSTDAAVTLGLIDPAYFLGGDLALDGDAARAAIGERIGRPLGLEPAEAALAVVRVQVASMVSGIRAVSVEQGLDPREFALLPFGGGGSLYAGLVAEEMGIGRILVPVHPSVLSALGMLMTDVKYTRVATRVLAARDADDGAVEVLFRDLETGLVHALRAEGIADDRMRLERSCDMRYHGQAYEVNVPAARGLDVAALVARFHAEHRTVYGQADEREPVELVNFRVTGVGLVPKARLAPRPAAGGPERAVPKGERRAYFGAGRGWLACPVFERPGLGAGVSLVGPALVEEPGATIVLQPGHRAVVDALGNLLVTVPGRA